VREGMEVEVRILATGRTHRGTLHRIGAEANPANRTFPLEVRLDNETGDLRGGMRATVLVQKSSLPSALIVPRDAILQNLDGREVFLVRDGLAVRRDVRTGPGRLGWVVVHEGLAAGDELVVRGQRSLVHGERVSAIQLGACCNDQLATASGTGALPDPAPPARDEDPGTPLADER
jgi:RND family efflux transporter MFP subunit